MAGEPTIDVRAASTRFRTQLGWLDSWHCFSFGPHYDPENVGHGLLIVSNDDRVAPSGGFSAHPHHDMEILTWVLEGELEHRDSEGNEGIIRPGLAQRMSAGTGIVHSEMNPSSQHPVHFLQMWVPPDRAGLAPSYEQADVSDALDAGALVPIASGRNPDASIEIHQRDATCWVARLDEGHDVDVPEAPFVHVFVARGLVQLDSHTLGAGDAARCSSAGSLAVRAVERSEIVVWESHARAR